MKREQLDGVFNAAIRDTFSKRGRSLLTVDQRIRFMRAELDKFLLELEPEDLPGIKAAIRMKNVIP